jgi:hypothetical protein
MLTEQRKREDQLIKQLSDHRAEQDEMLWRIREYGTSSLCIFDQKLTMQMGAIPWISGESMTCKQGIPGWMKSRKQQGRGS